MSQSVLKIIAMLTMLIDHIGILLFPDLSILRIIGRIAMPIFAYCIAEGCIHSKHKQEYLTRILCCAFAYQIIEMLVRHELVPCVLWGYAAAVGFSMIYETKRKMLCIPYAVFIAIVLLLTKSDYLCFPFVMIVLLYLCQFKWQKITITTVILLAASVLWKYQIWALLSLPLIILYNGKKGKVHIKTIVYWFYPTHYLILGIIKYLLGG